MKKILLSLVALMAMSVQTALAQDLIWNEDFSSFEANAVPSGGDYQYVSADGTSSTKVYNEALAGGEKPELLISKNGGSFTVTIPMNGKSGELTLSFKSNKKNLTVTAENATIGEKSATGNDYQYPVTVAAGTESVTFIFSNSSSSNIRFDNARLFSGEAKKPAGITWGTASRDVTLGAEDNNLPTLSNTNNLPVTYSSDNTEVATIDAEGTITLVAAGTANLTASFAGNDEYEAAEVTVKLNVKAAATEPDPSEDITNTPETAYTVAQANELIAAGKGLDSKVYVAGTITKIKEVSTQYGNATFWIGDEATRGEADLQIYRGYFLENEKFTAENQIKVGDKVVMYGLLVDYNGTKEMKDVHVYSLNGNQTVGIRGIEAGKNSQSIYNLAGQRVGKAVKGIYVINGKKVVK